MLTNKQKYDYYVKTYERIERGWIKKGLGNKYGGACLVGAINFAVTGDEEAAPSYWAEDFSTKYSEGTAQSRELQLELATEILPPKKRFLLSPRPITVDEVPTNTSGDGGLRVIEEWNDSTERRKQDVLAVIQKRIDYYAPLVRDQEIERLQAQVADLRAQLASARTRIADLETQVAQLQQENILLRKSKTKYTAEQLRGESDALRKLDDELNATMAELEKWGVSV